LRIVPGAALAGSVAPNKVAIARNGILALQHLHHDRAGNHEVHELAEERALTVHRIERFRLLTADAVRFCAMMRGRLLDHALIAPVRLRAVASV